MSSLFCWTLVFYFSAYCPSLFRHSVLLSTSFLMQRTMLAAVQATDERVIAQVSVSDANFYPSSTFLHQRCIVGFVEDLSPSSCSESYPQEALSPTEKRIIAYCSLRDEFNGNVTKFYVYKWGLSGVIIIKLTSGNKYWISYKMYISDFLCSEN